MRLNRQKFLTWLRTKEPDEVVGERRDSDCCPVANFCRDAGAPIHVFTDGDGYWVDRGYSKCRPPRWAGDFLFEVDGGQRGVSVTAKEALAILATPKGQ